MPKIPETVSRSFLPGFLPDMRGKVRDTYVLKNGNLLPGATDRLSAFDFVLPVEVPYKGEVLTAMNIFWATYLEIASVVNQDIVAFGSRIDSYLQSELRGNADIQKRATVVKKCVMDDGEGIVRGYLTGGGWKTYKKTAPNHMLCGHVLPPGLKDGDRLDKPIFTPTTKAKEGHDADISVAEFRKLYPRMEPATLELYGIAHKFAHSRGIILADTKLEFGIDPVTGTYTLCDERFTPDSSRFWRRDDWEKSRKEERSPTSYDKQFVRVYLESLGIDKLDPLNPEHVAQVHALVIPADIVWRTSRIYRYICYLLTEMRLETFQREVMGISGVTVPPIEIVLGSESDLKRIQSGLVWLDMKKVHYRLHILSCHYTPHDLVEYARTLDRAVGPVVAAAGKAAALAGILQSWLRYFKKDEIPVLGVGLEGDTEDANLAARLSITELPGRPVVMRDDSTAYFGSEGFVNACEDAVMKEFISLPAKPREAKLNFIVK